MFSLTSATRRVNLDATPVTWRSIVRLFLTGLPLMLVSCLPRPGPMPSPPIVESTSPPSPSAPLPSPSHTPVEAAPPTQESPGETVAEIATAVLGPTQAAPAPAETIVHTVEPGEALLGLAVHYRVPMAAIQLQNQLGAETGLRAGQVLDIPPADQWEGASPFWVVHQVEEGATLSGIAQQYELDIAALRSVNQLTDDDFLRVGQSLILPLDAPADGAARGRDLTATPTSTSTPRQASVVIQASGAATEAPEAAPAQDASSPSADTPLASAPSVPSEVETWPAEVFRLINAVRADQGLAPFTYNEVLARAAQLHGEDCRQRGSCNHSGSDGSTIMTRVLRAGYDAAGSAECIVYSRSPQEAVDWWMDEVPPNDAHRRTLLSTWVTEAGISVVPTGRGDYYFIMAFGRPNTP